MDEMKATWTGGLRFELHSATGHDTVTDAPVDVGGTDSAPTPMELVMLGLLGCTGLDVASMLHKMKQPLEHFEVRATHERAEKHPRIFTRIHLIYELRGDLSPKKVQRAVDLSESTYCSVSAMLRETTEITNEVRINP